MSDMLLQLPAVNTPAFSPAVDAGRFERIPKWLNLFPMIAQWLWLGLRYGSLTLPSAANPAITTGGMVGDGKLEYFRSMGPLARAATADFIPVAAGEDGERMARAMIAAGLPFPVVAKPDLGWCGYGVRLLKDAAELEQYAAAFPAGETFILQRFIPDEGEAGLFYARFPGERSGKIVGVLLRQFPKIVGDGRRSIAALIGQDVRLRRLTGNKLHDCSVDMARIPPMGEEVRLALIGSTRVGGLYLDATAAVTVALTRRLDDIARDMGAFEVGRFDVRYKTMSHLLAGDFVIMEVNGAGSEAVHAWDPKYTIRQTYKIVFAKQRLLFRIGAACRKDGRRPCGLFQLTKLHFHQQRLMKLYPRSN